MKDFAKSIRVGNAYTKGQVLGEEEGKKYVFGGEINGTYIVHRQPDGKTFSFSSEQEIKDWMRNSKIGNKKVGNYDAQEKLGLKPVQGEIEKEVYSVYTQTGKDKEKTKKVLKSKHPHLDEQWLDKLLSKLVGNESIFKQEASMFEGLKKDADKEIGNSLPHDYHNRYPSDPIYADMKSSATLEAIKKEPWRVYDIMGVGDSIARERVFEMIEEKYKIDYNDIYEAWLGKSWDKAVQKKSFDESKKLAQKLGLRFGNKTGNADTVSEYNAEIQRLTKKAEQLRRMGQGRSAMEIEKQIEKLGKEMREAVGNETKGERKFGKVMGEYEEGALKTPQGKTVTDPAQAKAIAYSEADKVDNLKRARNAMNKKVGNLDNVEEGDYVSVRYQGEIVDGVVRKIQGTQALVTIDGTDMWFPIRSLKEST